MAALQTLSDDNHESGGCYAFWFKSFEQALIGRGKMGTLVGASEEVKRHGGPDPSLNEYTVCLSCYFFLALMADDIFLAFELASHQRYSGWH